MTARDAGRYTSALQPVLPEGEPLRASDRERRRVLVVDDLPEARQALAALLEWIGHEVFTAPDGEEALQLAQRVRPDAVLLDLEMPRMDGYEACRRLRSTRGGHDLLIVAVSAWNDLDDRLRGLHSGFDFHLGKPADAAAIARLIAALDA
jgi:CheY-like chemotaxis protein